MNLIDWFRTKKTLIKQNNELKELITKRLKEVIKIDSLEQNKLYLMQIPNMDNDNLNSLHNVLQEITDYCNWTPPTIILVNSYIGLTEMQEKTILDMAKEIKKQKQRKKNQKR